MAEEIKKAEQQVEASEKEQQIEQEAKATELSDKDLDKVAGGADKRKKGYIGQGSGNAGTF